MASLTKIVISTGLSVTITLSVMMLVSQIPGMAVPLAWWFIGAVLPVVISVPITFLLVRQAENIDRG